MILKTRGQIEHVVPINRFKQFKRISMRYDK